MLSYRRCNLAKSILITGNILATGPIAPKKKKQRKNDKIIPTAPLLCSFTFSQLNIVANQKQQKLHKQQLTERKKKLRLIGNVTRTQNIHIACLVATKGECRKCHTRDRQAGLHLPNLCAIHGWCVALISGCRWKWRTAPTKSIGCAAQPLCWSDFGPQSGRPFAIAASFVHFVTVSSLFDSIASATARSALRIDGKMSVAAISDMFDDELIVVYFSRWLKILKSHNYVGLVRYRSGRLVHSIFSLWTNCSGDGNHTSLQASQSICCWFCSTLHFSPSRQRAVSSNIDKYSKIGSFIPAALALIPLQNRYSRKIMPFRATTTTITDR